MDSYRSFLKEIVDTPAYRERVEWSNFWIDSANVHSDRRVLFIGDSNLRKMRSRFAALTGAAVDFIGSSSNLEDELFVTQIDAFFNGRAYRYDCIYVQYSHHGVFGLDGGEYTDADLARYAEAFLALIAFLRQYSQRIVLLTIFDSVVPGYKLPMANRLEHWLGKRLGRRLGRRWVVPDRNDEMRNAVSHRKNDVIRRIAAEQGCPLVDAQDFLSRSTFRHIDNVHYESGAYECLIRMMRDAADC